MSKIERKMITYDINDPNIRKIYSILDKVRYSQSKLITKLLSEFFAQYDITEDTPYEEVKLKIKNYLAEDMTDTKFNPVIPTQDSGINKTLLSLITQQQQVINTLSILQNSYQSSVQQPIIPLPQNQFLDNEEPESAKQPEPIKERLIIGNEPQKFIEYEETDEDDDCSDDFTLNKVAVSFKNLLYEND